jgi:non-specific serine/threonine protein kinase/serine/threonine-protein kinase
LVRGDLDWIVMKCLEKDRNRRYETANALTRDLERYLHDEPVQACPPSAGYRLRKFARKHRFGLATAAAIVLLLVAGVAVSTWQAVRATQAEHQAAQAAQRAQALNRFLTEHFLAELEPGGIPRDRPLSLQEVLETAGNKIDQAFDGQPELAAQLHHSFGATCCNQGFWNLAQTHLEKALEVRRELYGPERLETMDTVDLLATALQFLGRHEDAERMFRSNLETSRRCRGPEDQFTLRCMHSLAALFFYARRLAEAETLDRECLDLRRRRFGTENIETLTAAGNLAIILHHEGKLAEAEALFRSTLETLRRVFGANHPSSLQVEQNFFQLLKDQGNFSEAATVICRNLAAYRRVYGPNHPRSDVDLDTAWIIAEELLKSGQYAAAEPCLREYLTIVAQQDSAGLNACIARSVLGGALLEQKKYAKAEPLLLAGYAGMKRHDAEIPPESKGRLTEALEWLVQLYEATGKADEVAKWRKELQAAKAATKA